MPAGTATASARPRPAAVSSSVAGSVWKISVSAGTWCLNDSPKSPRTARPRKRTYCSQSGSSSPRSARSCRTSSSRASSGSSRRVGSPVRCSSPKTMTETPSRTPRLCSSRRATYPTIPSERNFGQPDRLVAAWRPLQPIVDAVDVHLLIAENHRRIVVDQAQQLTVELLTFLSVHLGACLVHQLVDFGVAVLRDRLAGLEIRRHPVIGLEAPQAPTRSWAVLGLVIQGRAHVRAPFADDLDVGLDAVLGELSRHRLRDVLVHRPAAVGRLQHQRQIRLTRRRQQLLGLLGVVLVERNRRVVAPD